MGIKHRISQKIMSVIYGLQRRKIDRQLKAILATELQEERCAVLAGTTKQVS